MTSAPSQILFVASRAAAKWQVRMGSASGAPTSASETETLRDPIIRRIAGPEPDTIACIYDLGKTGERLQDLETPTAWDRQMEVCQALEDPDKFILIAAGELLEQEIRLSADDGEVVIVNAMIPPFWWGNPLKGPTYLRATGVADTFESFVSHEEITFNPEIDGVIEYNRANDYVTDTTVFAWLDPESARTERAKTIQEVEPEEWSMEFAVETLCAMCNPDETYITNPLSSDVPIVSNPVNVRLRPGQYLPQLLDQLLTPVGVSWYLKPEYDASTGARKLSIKFFKLNVGPEKEVYHAAPGEVATFGNSNLVHLNMSVSLLEMANQIYVYGGYIEREVTITLYRGWLEADDDRSAGELHRDGPEFTARLSSVWRKWVANEAGDYCGMRTITAAIPADPLDLTDVLGEDTIFRRRVFSDPLTYENSDGTSAPPRRRQPLIEYSVDAGTTWEVCPGEWGARVLDRELGVYFSADEPPGELIDAGDDARVRITATIRGDTRLNYTATRQSNSPLAGTIELHLDWSDRYFDREVVSTGDLASVLADEPDADERDDLAAMTGYADYVQTVEDASMIRAELTLFGIHLEYEIGDLITRVNGRNISFNRKSESSPIKTYLQVLGIAHDWGRQTTTLITQALDEVL